MVKVPAKTVNVRRGLALAGALLLVNSLHADVVAGVLPTSAFMRYIPKAGTWIIVR